MLDIEKATDDELRQLSATIRKEWKRRIHNDPNVYVIKRLFKNASGELVRYYTSRDGLRGFEARDLDNPHVCIFTTQTGASFVVELKTASKMVDGLEYIIEPWAKSAYYASSCYRQRQINILQDRRHDKDPVIAAQALEFIVAFDMHRFSGGVNPMDSVRAWLNTLEKDT